MVVGVFDPRAVDVITENLGNSIADSVCTFAITLVLEGRLLAGSVDQLDVRCVDIEVNVINVERAEPAEPDAGVPDERPHRVVARGVLVLVQVPEYLGNALGVDRRVAHLVVFRERGEIHQLVEVWGDRLDLPAEAHEYADHVQRGGERARCK